LNPVIAIAGPVGAGKSTLVRGLAGAMDDTTVIHFDHYERMTEQPIEEVRRWMEAGADLNRMPVPGLADALGALKEGHPVRDPLSGARVPAAGRILFETQFGRQHADTGRHIDFLIWIETPLDLALARKVRQFASGIDPRNAGEVAGFGPWLEGYLDNYVNVVGSLLRMQRDTVGADADCVVDGSGKPAQVLESARQAIVERFG
jgi:energy-coupling factor transporter ATP-binding protein EcfA2